MSFITLEFKRQDLDDWEAGFSRQFRNELKTAQSVIAREWIYELYRQSSENVGDGWWEQLEPIYEARKDKKYPENAGNVLQASGDMLRAYTKGISFLTTNALVGVSIPFPEGKDGLKAEVHEGERNTPRGMTPRPFNRQPFFDIAYTEFNDAMVRAIE